MLTNTWLLFLVKLQSLRFQITNDGFSHTRVFPCSGKQYIISLNLQLINTSSLSQMRCKVLKRLQCISTQKTTINIVIISRQFSSESAAVTSRSPVNMGRNIFLWRLPSWHKQSFHFSFADFLLKNNDDKASVSWVC